MNDIFVRMRKARILIPDNTPLSLLAMVGPDALDWLFAEVWVTDMVKYEALRDPDEGGDQRERHRRDIANWFERNKHLIHEQPNRRKRRVRRSNGSLAIGWDAEESEAILERSRPTQYVGGARRCREIGRRRRGRHRDRRRQKGQSCDQNPRDLDVDLMATETYLEWLVRRFGIKEATTAWTTIKIATDKKAPNAPDEDPVHIYKIK
jgi:hypothetical protein